jgi:hypothetical protein
MVCDAVVMIVSLAYRTVRGLLSLPKLLLQREASMERRCWYCGTRTRCCADN